MTSLPISVIIPTYNRCGGLLENAIDSVLAQTHQQFELLIVDDGSTDNTAERILQRYGNSVRIVTMSNRGPGAARNHGLQEASHDLIAFLDSDDWWDSRKLEIQVQVMAENPDILISHTDEIWYRGGKVLNQKKRHTRPHGDIFRQCISLCCVGMSTVMMRREFFDIAGGFDESLPCCEDYDLWVRASGQIEFFKVDHPLTYKQGGREDQVSEQHRMGMDQFRITSLEKCLHLHVFSREQRMLLARELVRKSTIYGNGCVKHDRVEAGQKYLDIAERWKAL